MASQKVRPLGGSIHTTRATFAATLAAGVFAVIDPADGQVKAIGAAVTGKVVVTAQAVTSGEKGTVYTEGIFLATSGVGATRQRGDFVVPSNTDTQTFDDGTTNDVQMLELLGPVPEGSGDTVVDGAAAMVQLHPNRLAAGTVA